MNPKEKLRSLLKNEYRSEYDEVYKIRTLEGMSDSEINSYKEKLPNKHLSVEIMNLLKFTRGFEFEGLDEIRFDTYGQFGLEEVFPNSIPLAGDGFGNFWILDIDSKGNWKEVYYICHDPAVVIKHSKNLTQFLEHIHEFGVDQENSILNTIHEKTVMNVWDKNSETHTKDTIDYIFSEINKESLPESFVIADLIKTDIKSGFATGKSGPETKIIRDGDRPVWVIEVKKKKSFLSKLFNR